ncbi:MAG: right-handed parallel beta-helix repeat-containing protein [Thermoplasmata archaeon]|nr:right-handed parallel beta-helix repeat-containing protein [Thermoplasmata archaeon]
MDNGGGEMSWAGKKVEIVSVAFLVVFASMYGLLFQLNANVVAGTEFSGHITTDTNWTSSDSPYWIVGDTFVDPNVTLRIEPGVEVFFNGTYYFNVSGNLVTHGDVSNMVIIASEKYPDPFGQVWQGIYVRDEGSLVMDHTVVSNAYCGITVLTDNRGQSSVSIRGSDIFYNIDCGVKAVNYTSIYISDSQITHSKNGIDLGSSIGAVIENSIISFNEYGIVGNYSYARIQNSDISYNSQFGIYYESQSGTTVSNSWYWNNTIHSNGVQTPPGWSGAGIYLLGAYYDQVSCNVMTNNGVGLSLHSSYMVTTHHNDFVYNHANAIDDLYNQFDDGSEGNYWDDYNGSDSNGDGIGDTPYNIDNNSVDNYPLMYPLGGCGVSNLEPVADANGPYSGKKYWPVDFDGTGSYDQDGSIIEYAWDFGDGSPKGYGETTNHTYSGAGIYNVTLKVTDNNGASDNDTTYVEIIDGYPDAPGLIDAVLSGASQEDVDLSWELSGDDGAGEDDLAGYNIYRGTVYDPDCLGYILVSSAPSGSTGWTDALGGHGDTNTYFYCVGAVDDAGQETLDGQQVSKFAKHMASGMVLMSVPVVTSDTLITTVFQTVNYVRVIYYDANAGKRHNWKTFDTRKPYSDVFDVDHTMAVWVEVISDGYLTVAGLVPQQTTIHLVVGWNFVGYPSFADRTVSDTITVYYQTMETFDPLDPPWYLQRLGDTDLMTAGEGYWIHVSEEFNWVLTN